MAIYHPLSDVDGDETLITSEGSLNVNQTNINTRAILVDSDNTLLDIEHYEEHRGLRVAPAHRESFTVLLSRNNIQAATPYLLVDLDNGGGAWLHPAMTLLEIRSLWIELDPDTNFLGDIQLGFLENVDADNGDFHCVFAWHFERQSEVLSTAYDQTWSPILCGSQYHFGAVDLNSATWQTDVAIGGPDGNNYVPGNGDLVVNLTRTAGATDITFLVVYQAHEHP